MKAILEFDLPEESEDHMLAVSSGKLAAAIFDFDQKLRRVSKYSNDDQDSLHATTWRAELRDSLEGLEWVL